MIFEHLSRDVQILRAENESFKQQFRQLRKKSTVSTNSGLVRNLITRLFFVICLIVGTYHGFQITKEYLEYSVTAEALFYPIDPVIPPMVTLCVKNNFNPNSNCSNPTCGDHIKLLFNSVLTFREAIISLALANDSNLITLRDQLAIEFLNMTSTTFNIYGSICYAIDISKYQYVNTFTY